MKLTGLTAAAVLAAAPALADIQITMSETNGTDRESQSTIFVRNGKVAMKMAEDRGIAIYDSATGELTQIDHNEKEYMVLDQQTMDQAADQMSAMMKQVEEQLANLPAEQREAMLKMMPGMAGQMGTREKLPGAKVEWSGDKDEVAGYKCRVAAIVEPDGNRSKACIARPADLGMSKEDFQAVASMFETMQSFAKRFQTEAPMPGLGEMEGVPIRMSDPSDGSTVTLVSVDNSSVDDGLFEVPAGYKRRTMMDAGH